MYVDPEVSRRKFNAEVENLHQQRDNYVKRGIWILKEEFPTILVAFAKPLKPAAVVFGALLDFTDYDLRPPSVTLVDPFTSRPLQTPEMMVTFARLVPPAGPNMPPAITQLLQSHSDNRPFICLPGIREYHEHPAHTGDSWLLHRGSPEGTLHFLLEKLHHYGTAGILNYGMNLSIGFQANAIE
jgi:hypothetical protein